MNVKKNFISFIYILSIILLILILILICSLINKVGTISILGITIFLAFLFFLIIFYFPKIQTKKFRANKNYDPLEVAKLENEYRKTMAQIIGGTVILVGLYFTWQQITLTNKQLNISYEGQISERFTRAIDQLGSEKLEVRVGGVYSLGQVGNFSKNDHLAVLQTLSSFVREHAKNKKLIPYKRPENTIIIDIKPGKKVYKGNLILKETPRLRADIYAALNVIKRRKEEYRKEERNTLNFGKVDIRGADLSEGHFERSIFCFSNLRKVKFLKTHLENADLRYTSLHNTDFTGAYLNGTDFSYSVLHDANFNGVNLSMAKGLTWKQLKTAVVNSKTKLPLHIIKEKEIDDKTIQNSELNSRK